MKGRRLVQVWAVLALLVSLSIGMGGASSAGATSAMDELGTEATVGTVFTYQGLLRDGSGPVNATCDLRFKLWDAASGGSQVSWTWLLEDLVLVEGLFTAQLDFGAEAFRGQARYLEVAASCPVGSAFVPLPRQELTGSPYALWALGAPWAGLVGVPADLADGDQDTTYTPGAGLVLEGTEFRVNRGEVQWRVSQTCAAGSSIRAIDVDGTVTCETDDNTTYSAGTGLSLVGGQFSVNFAGTGSAGTASRSDHNHDAAYVNEGQANSVSTGMVQNSTLLLEDLNQNGCSTGQIIKWNGSAWACAADATGGTSFWSLTGNAGTVPGTNYLGTSDNVALEIRVNGARALRIEPGSSPNLLGGWWENFVTAGARGATIGGGGSAGDANRVTDSWGTVGGGTNNQAGDDAGDSTDRPYATVGGGAFNTASGTLATIGGGGLNSAIESHTTVGGGYQNAASDSYATVGGGLWNTADGEYATVGGGRDNIASGADATVGGGRGNTASGDGAVISGGGSGTYNPSTASGAHSTIGGGLWNTASGDESTIAGGYHHRATGWFSTVGGGSDNEASEQAATVGGGIGNTASGPSSVVAGGGSNTASAIHSTVGGGLSNTASGERATVGGGYSNMAGDYSTTVSGGSSNTANADYATVGGGYNNLAIGANSTVGGGTGNGALVTDSTVGGGNGNVVQTSGSGGTIGGGWHNFVNGNTATVPGGAENEATGGYSFAAGAQAHATHAGAFVWSSATATDSWGTQTFTVRSHGGARFYSAAGTGTGVQLSAGGTSFGSISDRNAKEVFAPVDTARLLEVLAGMPVQTWNLKSQASEVRHIGPVAQDFNGSFAYLFGEVESPIHINNMDAVGISLAASQGLYELSQEQAIEIAGLQAENTALRDQLDNLEARLASLEAGQGAGGTSSRMPSGWLLLGGGVIAVGAVVGRRAWGGGR